MIQISLKEYVNLLIGSKEYAVIDSVIIDRLSKHPNFSNYGMIENTGGTVDWQGRALEPLIGGLARLWSRQSADAMDRVRQIEKARREATTARLEALRDEVRMIFLSLGFVDLTINMLLPTMSKEQLEQTVQSSKQQLVKD